MTPQEAMPTDHLIEEVRARRKELFRQCGNSLQKLLELIQKKQAEHPDKVVDRRKRIEPGVSGS